MPHGHHIYDKVYYVAKAKMCAYSQSDHALPYWKCVLQCCVKFPSINITEQEIDYQYPNPTPSISFHIYHLIARCTKHVRLPLTDNKSCRDCQQDTASGQSTEICPMGIIFMTKYITWQRQKCVHTHSQIMHYHTGNVYCNVVSNFQALILLNRK